MSFSRDSVYKGLFLVSASSSILLVALIFLFLSKEAFNFVVEQGFAPFLATRWTPVSFQQPTFGVIPLVSGTVVVCAIACAIAVPLGIVCAVYIAELASSRERETLKPLFELLAGIPSVVLGFFGMVTIVPAVRYTFGLGSGLTALSAALVLALMALPTIITVSEDAIRNVPASYRQASLALGATEMTTIWRVVFPAALSGIVAAVMLGIGRVIGETMAVLMLTGNAPVVSFSPFESVRTMTATVAAEMGEVAFGSTHYRALFFVGLLLLIATFTLNVISHFVLQRYRNVSR